MTFSLQNMANSAETKVLLLDDGPEITGFYEAEQACKDFLGGTIPNAKDLKEIVTELGDRLRADYYWSSTPDTACGGECRIQIEKATLKERSENVNNPTGALICTTQEDDGTTF